MPPNAVADYLMRIWDCKKATVKRIPTHSAGNENGILGVGIPGMTPYDGLGHYLYRYNNVIYSWGEEFNSV